MSLVHDAAQITGRRNVTYNLGAGNTLFFPAHSLCDMGQSTYGVGQWDQPCVAATTSVTVNTKAWLDAKGYAHVDFDKHVRFVPTSDPAGLVMLSLSAYGASTLAWLNIAYCTDAQTPSCTDESKSDPSVATVKDPVTGRYMRHVKHFSGYSLTSGLTDDYSM